MALMKCPVCNISLRDSAWNTATSKHASRGEPMIPSILHPLNHGENQNYNCPKCGTLVPYSKIDVVRGGMQWQTIE